MKEVKQAMETLSEVMQKDSAYAWGWHCNLAMMAYDAGAPHKEANIRAANFMNLFFKVDTSRNNPEFAQYYWEESPNE